MSNDTWSGTGYDASAASPESGRYFRLKTKGQTARLRLVSEAYRFLDTLPDGKEVRKVAWTAILKEIVNGAPVKRAVIFESGPMVYGMVKELAESEGWGDPSQYDLSITRTEEKGRYYTVIGLPKPMGPISADERKLVDEAAIDLAEAVSKKTAKTNGAAAPSSDYNPFEDE